MTTPTTGSHCKCPQCSALVEPTAKLCWLCRWEFRRHPRETQLRPAKTQDARVAHEPRERQTAFQFGLSAALLVMTAAAIVLSIFAMSPGLGIAAVILLTPPLVRTCWVAAREQARGTMRSATENTQTFVQVFVATLIALIVGGIAAVIAFFAICLAGANAMPESGLSLGAFIVGGFIAIVVFFAIGRALSERYSWETD